jgi:hypothetical protein
MTGHPGDWHEQETRRLNKRSMRRAILASLIIVAILWIWLIGPHV